MYPAPFEYFAPRSLEEAISLLEKYKGDAKVIAGGQSLIILMKHRLARPKYLIDLNRIPGLEYVIEGDEGIRIGAMTRMNDIAENEIIKKFYPIIYDAAINIADSLVRNMGTIGGNLCHGDPANDMPAAMIALNAIYTVRGPKGERKIKAEDFYIDTFQTALEPDEILTEIFIPKPEPKHGSAYEKIKRRVGDFAIAAVGASISVDENLRIKKIGIALTSLGPKVLKVDTSELIGSIANEETFEKAGELAYKTAKPFSDIRGPAEYKKDMAKVLTIRALNLSLKRILGK